MKLSESLVVPLVKHFVHLNSLTSITLFLVAQFTSSKIAEDTQADSAIRVFFTVNSILSHYVSSLQSHPYKSANASPNDYC